MKENEIIRQFNMNATEHQTIMEQLKDLGDTLKKVEISIAELPQKILDKTDDRYASKDTEIALKRLNWIVITAFAGLGLILQIK